MREALSRLEAEKRSMEEKNEKDKLALMKKHEELESQNLKMQEALRESEAERSIAAKSNKRLLKKNEELESQVTKNAEALYGWCKMAEKVHNNFDERKEELAQMKRDHDAVKDKLNRAVDEKNKLQTALNTMVSEKESIARLYGELLKEQTATNAEMKKVEAERKVAVDSIAPTKVQLALQILENSKLTNELKRLKIEEKARADDLSDAKSKLDKANSELKTATMEKGLAKKHIQDLDIALDHYKDDSEKYKGLAETYEKEKEGLKRALTESEYKLEVAEDSEKKKDVTIADLRRKAWDMNEFLNQIAEEKNTLITMLEGTLSPRYMADSRTRTDHWLKYFNDWIQDSGANMALLPTNGQPMPIMPSDPTPMVVWETMPTSKPVEMSQVTNACKIKREPLALDN